MSTLWHHIHDVLDHGSSMTFTVTKTGIQGELLILVNPGRNGESANWLPPLIFKGQASTLDEKFAEHFASSPIADAMDLLQNRDTYMATVEAMGVVMNAINNGLSKPRSKDRAKEAKRIGNGFYSAGDYARALEAYTNLNNIKPDKWAQTRIEICVAMIGKEKREWLTRIKELEQTDPFKKEGFGISQE